MKFYISLNGERKIFGPRFSATKGTYMFYKVNLQLNKRQTKVITYFFNRLKRKT